MRLGHLLAARSPVVDLLCFGGPSAIAWLVRPVIVDSVDGMARGRSLAHIGEERLETVPPSVAYGDAASAVVLPANVPRIRAALHDSTPRVVLGSSLSSSAVTMSGVVAGAKVAPVATAGLCIAPEEMLRVDVHRDAAGAVAVPVRDTMDAIWRLSQNGEPSKNTSSQVRSRSRHTAV